MELKKAKRILILFRVTLILGILFLVVSLGSVITAGILKNDAYTQFTTISPSTESQIRKDTYKRAIRLAPSKAPAYGLLIDVYNEDGIFTKSESEEFLSIYNSNHTKLQVKDPEYPKLHYTAGFLYINGFEGSFATRLRMALPFLEISNTSVREEDPYRFAIACYCRIGTYYRDYIWDAASSTREVSASQMQSLIADIETTLQQFPADTSPDAVYNYLGFCTAVCNLLYDQRDTLAATVPKAPVTEILDVIYSTLPNPEQLRKESTKALVNTLLANEETYRNMIARAFERKGS